MATITKKIKIKSLTSPSVIVANDGSSVKIPSNFPFPAVGDEITVNSDWILAADHPDTKPPVPVKLEDVGTDAAQAAKDAK